MTTGRELFVPRQHGLGSYLMFARTTLILLDAKPSRHSTNALVAALETDADFDSLELRLPAGEVQLAQHLEESLTVGKRPIVGLSFTTLGLGRMGELMVRMTGRFGDRALWVAGGPHPTADPQGMLRLGFDVVVRGEGEAILLDLLKTAASRGDLSKVPGVVVRGSACPSESTIRPAPVDLDRFPPFPLRRRRVVGPIEITRGCPFACAYCQTSHLLGMQPRHRSVEVIARYAAVIRQRGLRDVRVIAPDAFSYGSPDGKTQNLAALESLLTALRRALGREGRLFFGTFPSEVRPEHVNPDALELVKRFADNDNLILGAQSGSERMLASCGRGHGVADIFSAVSQTLIAGLTPHVDFIFGLPGESDEDLADTVAVIRELAAMGALIHAHTFMPLPQTRFAGATPGRIHGRVRPFVRELIRAGRLYGVWRSQELAAQRIAAQLDLGPPARKGSAPSG